MATFEEKLCIRLCCFWQFFHQFPLSESLTAVTNNSQFCFLFLLINLKNIGNSPVVFLWRENFHQGELNEMEKQQRKWVASSGILQSFVIKNFFFCILSERRFLQNSVLVNTLPRSFQQYKTFIWLLSIKAQIASEETKEET